MTRSNMATLPQAIQRLLLRIEDVAAFDLRFGGSLCGKFLNENKDTVRKSFL